MADDVMTGGDSGWRLAWRMARREIRGSVARFRVFLGALMLGVAAIGTVGSVAEAMKQVYPNLHKISIDFAVMEKAEGVVMLEGEPLEGAVVLFQPSEGGKPATGLTDAAGKFVLTTHEQGDGAQVGVNKVSVTKELPSANAANVEEGEITDVELGTPARYASPDLSGLTVTVESGLAPVTLELTWEP